MRTNLFWKKALPLSKARLTTMPSPSNMWRLQVALLTCVTHHSAAQHTEGARNHAWCDAGWEVGLGHAARSRPVL